MIRTVTFEKTTYNELPWKFEAGTPNIAGAIALAAAIDYMGSLGFGAIEACEHALLGHATGELQNVDGVRLIGTAAEKSGILSFVVDGIHAHDVGSILSDAGSIASPPRKIIHRPAERIGCVRQRNDPSSISRPSETSPSG